MNSWANNGDKSSSQNKKDAQYVQTYPKAETKKEVETLIVEHKKMVASAYKKVQEELAREEFDKLVHPKEKVDNSKDTEPKW